MNTTDLSAAYERLLAASQAITDDTELSAEQRADVDWTLCHVALSDRMLTLAAMQVRTVHAGTATKLIVDNESAMDPAAIATMTASTSHAQRITTVSARAAELIAELDQTSDQAAHNLITLRIHDKTGKHISDTDMTWADLIELRAHKHIPGHADRLVSYLSPQPG